MSGTSSLASASASAATPAAAPISPALKKAAGQFEAIFVRQMLASARKTHFDDKLFSSQGMDTFREQQDSHFADIAASRDSFGLTKMIEQRLAKQAGTAPTPNTAPATTPATATTPTPAKGG